MRFKQYLITEGRSVQISDDEARSWIKKNAKNQLKMSKQGNHIYRGVKNTRSVDTSLKVNPGKSKPRQSAYVGYNYYTLLMDNLPSWKQYPKRSQSIVCSTDQGKASDYSGEFNDKFVFSVYPKDGSNIAITPDDDIFTSFPKLFKETGSSYMGEWSTDFMIIDTNITGGKSDTSWKDMIKLFKYIDSDDHTGVLGRMNMSFLNSGDSLKSMDDIMNPKGNGFNLHPVGAKKLPKNREVWTDGESVLVSPEMII